MVSNVHSTLLRRKIIVENKREDEHIINQIVDGLDEIAMLHYYGSIDEETENTDVTNYNKERPTTHFYESLFAIIDYFLEDKPLYVSEEVKKQIDEKLSAFQQMIETRAVNSEEMRRALLLLDIKAFKNINFPLDLITPDAVGLIFARCIDAYFKGKKQIVVLDNNFGTGNLMFAIQNHTQVDIQMIGMDNHALFAQVAVHKANMMMVELDMYYQDALEFPIDGVDAMVSDIAHYRYENENYHSELYDQGVRYFPYLLIEHFFLTSSSRIGFYLINNSFFSQEKNDVFSQYVKKHGQILALITLPIQMFVTPEEAKSILIVSNAPSHRSEMHIFMLPESNDKPRFFEKLKEIEVFLEESRGK